MKTEQDPNFYLTHSPIEFLTFMAGYAQTKDHIKSLIIPTAPDNWIRKEHIAELIKLVRSRDRIQRIISSSGASNAPDKTESSSVGMEAQNLIECYRTRKAYPNFDYSSGQPNEIKANELLLWWTKFSHRNGR
jgi:hypothetical protein